MCNESGRRGEKLQQSEINLPVMSKNQVAVKKHLIGLSDWEAAGCFTLCRLLVLEPARDQEYL